MIQQSIYLFITALVLAYLEVQIEGQHGWASRLPTWKSEGLAGQVYKKIMSGKDLTGYHLGVFAFVLLFLHYPFLAGREWSIGQELWVLSQFFLFSAVWDYLWIIINPHYGVITKRPRDHVWWHKRWWGPFPRDYYYAVILSVLALSPLWYHNQDVLTDWVKMFGVFLIGVILTMAVVEMERGDIRR